ncbi:MAG: flagellar hook-basal body complex protein FliE [Mariprofundaceae bacterium]|nr:flagellar hook-basal body complex protein FliE [Mariprofundaceae bacterium]
MNIQGLPSQLTQTTQTESSKPKGNFGALLKQYTADVNHDIKAAGKNAEALAVDGVGNVTETMLAVKKAGLSFQLMMAARNKMVDAYREVMRMQV